MEGCSVALHQDPVFGIPGVGSSAESAPTQGGANELWTPSPAQLQLCWYLYVDNVDPIVRILHKPTMQPLLAEAQRRAAFESLPPAAQALLLAVCFAAIRSLDADRCRALFSLDAVALRRLCQRAAERALVRAGLLETHDLRVLQAYALLLVCGSAGGSRAGWACVGLALRVARSLGLHRDGGDGGHAGDAALSPLDTELRRRLWWELRLLDTRTAEDCGAAPADFADADTRLPLNVDDADLARGDTGPAAGAAPPPERAGLTEMSFSLFRYDMCALAHTLMGAGDDRLPDTHAGSRPPRLVRHPFGQLRRSMNDAESHLYCKYSYLLDNNRNGGERQTPFAQFAAKISQAVFVKIGLQSHLRLFSECSEGDSSGDSNKSSDDLFQSAVELLETYVHLVRAEEFASWAWILHHYQQWHAVSFVLSGLYQRVDVLSQGQDLRIAPSALPSILERAWNAIEIIFSHHQSQRFYDANHNGAVAWSTLESLRRQIKDKLDLPATDVIFAAAGNEAFPSCNAEEWTTDWGNVPMALESSDFGMGEDFPFFSGSLLV